MTLSQRTILIIVSTFIALLFILAATSDVILLSSYSNLEKKDITSHTRHILNSVNDKLNQLNVSAQEVAIQITSKTGTGTISAWTSRQLFNDIFMRSHGLDLLAVYDGAGHPAIINWFDSNKNSSRSVTVEQGKALADLVSQISSNEGNAMQGVVALADSPLMVAFKFAADASGVKQGLVVTGWFIDHAELERMFRASGASISTYDLTGRLLPDVEKATRSIDNGDKVFAGVVDHASIAGYFKLNNTFGQPSFIVRVVEKRILYEQGKVTIAYIFTALFLAGGVLCGVMLLFVRGTILSRLKSLTVKVQQISETRDISVRLPLSGHNDELITLAVSINSMLESLELAEAGLRESEERYRMLFDRAPDAIIIIGLEGEEAGRIISANQAAADQHGYTLDELCRLSIYDLNSDEANKIARELSTAIAAGEWVTAELWHQKKDGSQFPIEIHAGLIKIGGKKYILGFDRDITQRKINEETDHMHLERIRQLNEELSRKAIDLAAANHELETFNYSVSHDMRGPLTRIAGYCQLLLDDENELDPHVRDYISRIYESETWLNEMVGALLHLAQVTSVEIISDSVDLSAMAEAALKELSYEYPGRSIRTFIEPGMVVAGDERLLKMVLLNLLGNALKYSSARSDSIIEFGSTPNESGPVYYVRDNGTGFEMKNADKLFRVFSRLHDSSQFAGSGIGLATVQRIIFRHGGKIWAEAEPGIGATFFFTLQSAVSSDVFRKS